MHFKVRTFLSLDILKFSTRISEKFFKSYFSLESMGRKNRIKRLIGNSDKKIESDIVGLFMLIFILFHHLYSLNLFSEWRFPRNIPQD